MSHSSAKVPLTCGLFLALCTSGCIGGFIVGSAAPEVADPSATPGQAAVSPSANAPAMASPSPCVPAAPEDVVWGAMVSSIVTTADANALLASQPTVQFGSGQCDPPGAIPIALDANATYQTLLGFGVHLTDSSARLLSGKARLSEPNLNIFNDIFSSEKGIGVNLLHVDVADGEFASNGEATYDGTGDFHAPDNPNLSHFNMLGAEGHYTFSVLSNIRAANPNILIFAAPWSPPSWMKDSNTYVGGSLAPNWDDTMALYILKFLQGYQAQGNLMYAIAPQNEPDTNGNSNHLHFPSSLLPAAREASFIANNLGPLLRAADPNVKILGYEGDWSGVAHPLAVAADPTAASYLTGIAFHCDTGDASAQDAILAANPNLEVHITRCGRTINTSFATDLEWYGQHAVIDGLNHGASSLMMYNLALDPNNGRTNGGCTDCRGVTTVPVYNPGVPAVTRHVEYYVLGHVAKYFKRGAKRIGSTAVAGAGVYNVAVANPDGSFAAFLLNTLDTSVTLSLHMGDKLVLYPLLPHAVATLTWPAGPL